MKCPVCKETDLKMSDRQGIEIDYCPNCRGIWLDRGELDKLIERAATMEAAATPRPAAPAPPVQPQGYPQQPPYPYRPDLDDSKYGYKYEYKRRKSWWREIFD